MVVLNRIYTRTGDDGTTGLGTGERRDKFDLRVEAYGAVDEANAAIGLARLAIAETCATTQAMLLRIQNDLFDLGADLCTPPGERDLGFEPLRITPAQVERLEREIDELNANLPTLRSFVLPGGTAGATYLHLARTIARRAERRIVALSKTPGEIVGEPALKYINRLSDFLFVASRHINAKGEMDVLWIPGKNR